MKKFISIFAFALVTVFIAPSCSQDETFEEVVESSSLDVSYKTDDEKPAEPKP